VTYFYKNTRECDP
jgi:hypothetical protein